MNILIVGCGTVGSELAGTLSREGHTVSIVDPDESSFNLLPADYAGYCTAGVPIDRDVLRQAGIESCDALAAVSQDDNVNIMVCQLAREYFKIQNLIARIYDPRRENVFSHFGLRTICPTLLTVDHIKQVLEESDSQRVFFGSSTLGFHLVPVARKFSGISTQEIETETDESIFAVLHEDSSVTLVPAKGCMVYSGDTLIVARIVD